MANTPRPAALIWLVVATVIAALACLLSGLHLLPGTYDEGAALPVLLPTYDEGAAGVEFPWLLAFAAGLVSLVLVWRRSRCAPAWLLGFWTVALSLVPEELLRRRLAGFDFMGPWTALDQFLEQAGGSLRAAVLFFALFIPWSVVARITLDTRFRQGFGCAPMAATGYLPSVWGGKGWRRYAPVLLALVLFTVWDGFGTFALYFWGFEPSAIETLLTGLQGVLLIVLGLAPFAACAGLILWLRYERLTIDGSGVRLFVFQPRYSPFFAPWDRIRSIDLVVNDRGARSAVIRYRSRFLMPFSLGVHAKRYVNGEAAIDELLVMAQQSGVQIRRWLSPVRTLALGWATIALGFLCIFGQELTSAALMRGSEDPAFPANMDRIAGLFPLTAFHIASLMFVGMGFGLLSAYHRGDSRPALLVLLMITSQSFPDPIIHWLVWIATYAILTARLEPLIQIPAVPNLPLWQWELAFDLLLVGALFIALGYYVGVAAGRRRIDPRGVDGVREPRPVAPNPLVAGSAWRLEDV